PMETVGGDEMMMNEEGRSPLFSNEEEEGLNIKTHRTRSSIRYKEGDSPLNTNNAALNNDNNTLDHDGQQHQQQQRRRSSDLGSSYSSVFKSFSVSKNVSNNNGNESKYASMQELLDDEKSRSAQFDDELGIRRRRRCGCCCFDGSGGGCTGSGCCNTLCGGKSTKRRKVTCCLLLLVVLGGIVAGVLVYFLVLVPKSNEVISSNSNEEKHDGRPVREPAISPTVPSNNTNDDEDSSPNMKDDEEENFDGLDLVFKFTPLPSTSVVPTPSIVTALADDNNNDTNAINGDDSGVGGDNVTPTISPSGSAFIMVNDNDSSNLVSSTISNSPSNFGTLSSSLIDESLSIIDDDSSSVGNDGVDFTFPISDAVPNNNAGETKPTKLVISIPGNLTLNIDNTNDTITNDLNNADDNMLLPSTMAIDERNTLISILQTTIRDVVENDNNNELLVNDANGEVASVKDVIILSINGEDVITMLRRRRQQRRILGAPQLLRGRQRDLQRKLQTSPTTVTMIVEYELILEETCITTTACQETINTTQLYYEKNVIEYLEESIDDGSFTTALHDNVDDEIQMIVADSSVNATTDTTDPTTTDSDNDSTAVINLLQNAQVVNGTFSTVRVVVETTTTNDDGDDEDIGTSQDVNYTFPIMPSLDNTTDDDGNVVLTDDEVHNITLPPTISSMPTSPTVSPSPTNVPTSTSSIDTTSLAPSSNATLTNSSENIGNNETHHIINVTNSSLGTMSPTMSSNPTQLPASISPTSDPLTESLSMIPTSDTSNFSSPIVAMSYAPTLSPEPSVLVTTNGTTMVADVGLGKNDTSVIANETLPSSDVLNITNGTTIDSPSIPIANNT
ncbi:hypothetical protein N9140_00705, partial [bacterium]|nr:hypothetical protein [bacterium]